MLLLAVVSLEIPLALSLRDRVDAEVRSQAEGQADLVASAAADVLDRPARGRLDRIVATAAADVRGRVLVVDPRGRVLSDSAGPQRRGVSYATRPEIRGALNGRREQRVRFSSSLDTELLATAVPIVRGRSTLGAVRITQSTAAVGRAVDRIILALGLLGVVVLAVGMVAGLLIARSVARPITRLEDAARRVAAGDLQARAIEEGSLEQRSLAHSFNDMTARLARLLAVQREFVADASHQLRTPLTGIRLRIEEARAIGVPSAVGDELDAATREVDRMAHIVEELLLLSRAGDHELPSTRLDLGDVVERAVERWTPLAVAAGAELQAQPPRRPAAGWAPGHDVDRALDALVENAVRYAPEGSLIEVAVVPGGIEVRDRGPGLDPGEEELVWARFHRGRAGRRIPGGTGLGLTIARELARGWGGEATLRPREGGGAVAALELPPVRAAAREEAPA